MIARFRKESDGLGACRSCKCIMSFGRYEASYFCTTTGDTVSLNQTGCPLFWGYGRGGDNHDNPGRHEAKEETSREEGELLPRSRD